MNYIANNSDAEFLVLGKSDPVDLKKYQTIIIGSGVYLANMHKALDGWLSQIKNKDLHEHVKFMHFSPGSAEDNQIKKRLQSLQAY